jgi:hypothetical protein
MRKLFQNVLLCLLVSGQFIACTQKEKEEDTKNKKLKIQADARMSSEDLALAGEQLIAVHSFMLADRVFDMALEKDSENLRAGFYKNSLKSWMIFKGIAVRIKPFLRANSKTNMDDYERRIRNLPNSALKGFLLDGTEDIKDAKTIQDLLVQQREAYNDMRKFLRTHRGSELTINLNPYVQKENIEKRVLDECEVLSSTDDRVYVECDYQGVAQRKLNAADFIVIQQWMAGAVLFNGLFYTNYSYEGMEELSKIKTDKMSYQQKVELLNQFPKFATLRQDHAMPLLRELGSDLSAAARWVVQYQNSLCPNGSDSDKFQRRGFLLNKGICVDDVHKANSTLDQLDRALAQTILYSFENIETGQTESIEISPFAIFDHPVQDLRQVAPQNVNECDLVTEYKDPSIGGIFPNQDSKRLLQEKCNK